MRKAWLLAALATPLCGSAAQAQMPPLTTWFWQLSGSVELTYAAKVYDIDMEDTSPGVIGQLKSQGHTVICYFSAGTWEDWRSDASAFPASVKGKAVSGWASESWLDTRSQVVRDLMAKRMDTALAKGCNGLEPDNVDGYSNSPGFPLNKTTQIDYNKFLATAAHQRGLIVALKNATDLVPSLAPSFDFAIVEECFKYRECPAYSPFVTQGKAVLAAEYGTYSETKCAKAKALKFSLAFYNLNLNGRRYRSCL